MIIHTALQWAIAQLKKAGIDSSALDAEVLLAYALGSPSPRSSPLPAPEQARYGAGKGEEEKKVPSPRVGEGRVRGRAWVLAHSEYKLTRSELQKFRNFVRRRARREPLAYIVGHKEFYGLDFVVNRQVMVPRPESEALVEHALAAVVSSQKSGVRCAVVDVGTGSGAMVVALAKECSARLQPRQATLKRRTTSAKFFATDSSAPALKVARANARRHGVAKRITFLRGNLLKPLPSNSHGRENLTVPFDSLIVVANLPYLPTVEWRASAPEIKKWEPRQALDGGKDGLKYYREMFRQVSGFRCQVSVLCEICPHQIRTFKTIVCRYFPRAIVEAHKHIAVVRIN